MSALPCVRVLWTHCTLRLRWHSARRAEKGNGTPACQCRDFNHRKQEQNSLECTDSRKCMTREGQEDPERKQEGDGWNGG